MKRLAVALLILGGTAALAAPAHAGGRFWPGAAVWTSTGVVVGGLPAPRAVAAPSVLVYTQTSVYVAPAPVAVPVVPFVTGPPPVFVPPQWAWNGYGWVLLPGTVQ